MKTPPLILASRSPRRRHLLKQMGFRVRVKPSTVEEVIIRGESPAVSAKRIALEKAADVAGRIDRGIVVGADTIVVIGGTVLGKPKSQADASRMLLRLSGREHVVFTGFALMDARSKRSVAGVERTKVRFRRLEKKEIREYIASGAPMDKAGAYGIQDDRGALFVEKVDGCFYTVVGFPLSRFSTALKKFVSELNHSSGKQKRNGKKN